jgi:hypothetical protein
MQTLRNEAIKEELLLHRMLPLRELPWESYSRHWKRAVNENAFPSIILAVLGVVVAVIDPFTKLPTDTYWTCLCVNWLLDYHGKGVYGPARFAAKWIPSLRLATFSIFAFAIASTFFYSWSLLSLIYWVVVLFIKHALLLSFTSMPGSQLVFACMRILCCSLFLRSILVCAVLVPVYMSSEAHLASAFLFIPIRHLVCHNLERIMGKDFSSPAPAIYLDHAMFLLIYQCPSGPRSSVLWFIFMLVDFFFDQVGGMHPGGQFGFTSYGLVVLLRAGDLLEQRIRYLTATVVVFMLYAVSTPSVNSRTIHPPSFVQSASALLCVYATVKLIDPVSLYSN